MKCCCCSTTTTTTTTTITTSTSASTTNPSSVVLCCVHNTSATTTPTTITTTETNPWNWRKKKLSSQVKLELRQWQRLDRILCLTGIAWLRSFWNLKWCALSCRNMFCWWFGRDSKISFFSFCPHHNFPIFIGIFGLSNSLLLFWFIFHQFCSFVFNHDFFYHFLFACASAFQMFALHMCSSYSPK